MERKKNQCSRIHLNDFIISILQIPLYILGTFMFGFFECFIKIYIFINYRMKGIRVLGVFKPDVSLEELKRYKINGGKIK